MAILGKRNLLSVIRESSPGLYLDGGELGEILLPGRYIPANLKPKDKLGVFVYRASQAVNMLVTGATALGYQAIVENSHNGLLYRENMARPLQIGDRLKGFVRTIRPDGRLDLSLDASGYQRVVPLTDQIVKALEQNGGKLAFDDDSAPEEIRQRFGVSKKAFKQALGRLYKSRRIQFLHPGIQLLDNSNWSSGK